MVDGDRLEKIDGANWQCRLQNMCVYTIYLRGVAQLGSYHRLQYVRTLGSANQI
jgi:hypothetical protein